MAKRTFTEVNKRIADLTIQLQKLFSEYKKLESEGKTAAEINERLGKKISSVSSKLSTLSNVTRQYNKQVGISNAQRKETNANLEKAVKAHTNLTTAVNKGRVAQERANSANKGFGDGLASVFSSSSIGRAVGSVAKFLSIYTAISTAVSVAKEAVFGSITAFVAFEDSIGKLNAVTGATAEQTEQMSESIRKAAVQTRFTATEVSELALGLAKLGATSSEIPDLLLPISLAAQAVGEDLGTVGEVIFKVNNQFGLSSRESAATSQVLVAAINESALSLESFATAIQYVGPIANQIGLTFNETASFLQVLSDNGFTASRIGTGLRKIFIDLKKPGEDITVTLEKLAQENISLAEANALVGKTAAAQLITILRNTDALRENASASSRLTSSLAASAAQMSTTAGITDILKSSYEDLKISIGEALVNTELFTSAIGLVFPQAERLIRGYQLLNETLSSTTGITAAQKELDKLSEVGAESFSSLRSSLNIFKSTGQSEELVKLFDDLTKAGFSLGQAQTIIFKRTQQGQPFLNRYLKGLEATAEQSKAVTTAFNDTGLSIAKLGDSFVAFRGFQEIVTEQATETLKALSIEKERNRVVETYAKSIKEIKALGPTTDAAAIKAQETEVDVREEMVLTTEALNKEEARGILANKELINTLTGRVSGFEKVIEQLSEFTGAEEKSAAAAKKVREDAARAEIDEIKRRKAQLKDELARIKELRNEEVKSAEDRAKLLGEAAKTSVDRAKVEQDLNDSIAASNQRATVLIEDALNKLGPLYEDATIAVDKFASEFPSLVDGLQESLGDLSFLFAELGDDIDETFLERANDAINDSKGVISTYQKQVEELNKQFGENAGKTEEYFEALDKITTDLSAELLAVANSLDRTTTEGEAAYKIILQLLNQIETAAQRPSKGKDEFDWEEFWQEILVDSLESAVDTALTAIDKFNDVAFENTKNRLEAQRAAIQASADIENDILKSQLDNQLITEEEFRNRSEANRKKEIERQNAIDKQIFDAEQKRDRQQARSDFLQALGSVIINEIRAGNPLPAALISGGIAAAFATAGYASELSAINQRQFFPKRFAEGGMVEGPSHSQGGVPFSVAGRGGYEMEGGEFVVNKRAANLHRSLLEKINGSAKPTAMSGSYAYDSINRIPSRFASGGSVSPQQADRATQEQLSYLRAIAESNVAVASNTSKPVRAFVTQTDLRNNEIDRRIVNKNNRL
jgi:uncharacterized protein YdcH (DUF465 family)